MACVKWDRNVNVNFPGKLEKFSGILFIQNGSVKCTHCGIGPKFSLIVAKPGGRTPNSCHA